MITGMPRIAIAVDDFDAVVATFRDQFGMPVIDLSPGSIDNLGAKLAMCVPPGGSNIELMSPGDPAAPLSQSLQRFLDRRGDGLFALMLEAPVPDDEAERLLDKGLHVLPLMAGAGGRDVHPRSTHGVLIRVYPVGSYQAQQEAAEQSLNLTGINRVVIAVENLDEATAVYGAKLGLPIDPVTVDEEKGVQSVICHPPTGGMIELVSVSDSAQDYAKEIAEFLQSRGEGMFALVLQGSDLVHVGSALAERGLWLNSVTDDAIEIARSSTFGVQIRIEAS